MGEKIDTNRKQYEEGEFKPTYVMNYFTNKHILKMLY